MSNSMETKSLKNIVKISSNLNIKKNDTRNPITAIFMNSLGNPVDLSGAIVDFLMVKYKSTLINRRVAITDASNGLVSFKFNSGETSQSGKMKAEFKVTYSDNSVETFPNHGYIEINIEDNLQGNAEDYIKGVISFDGGTF